MLTGKSQTSVGAQIRTRDRCDQVERYPIMECGVMKKDGECERQVSTNFTVRLRVMLTMLTTV